MSFNLFSKLQSFHQKYLTDTDDNQKSLILSLVGISSITALVNSVFRKNTFLNISLRSILSSGFFLYKFDPLFWAGRGIFLWMFSIPFLVIWFLFLKFIVKSPKLGYLTISFITLFFDFIFLFLKNRNFNHLIRGPFTQNNPPSSSCKFYIKNMDNGKIIPLDKYYYQYDKFDPILKLDQNDNSGDFRNPKEAMNLDRTRFYYDDLIRVYHLFCENTQYDYTMTKNMKSEFEKLENITIDEGTLYIPE